MLNEFLPELEVVEGTAVRKRISSFVMENSRVPPSLSH